MSEITQPNGTICIAIVDDIYKTIRKRILNEQYAPSEKLSETQLAKEFNCSRTPIREALKRLEREGLVVIQAKSGSYIKPHNNQDNRNVLEVRAYIEALGIRLAIERKADTTDLVQIVEQMDEVLATEPLDMIAFGELHYEFHHTIIKLSQNDTCLQLYERLNLRSSTHFYLSMDKKMSDITQIEHRKIIQYINDGDKKGEKFMIDHLWKKKNKMPL